MSAYKTEQRHLRHRGRDFHFVSYEGQPANPRREIEATQAAWYLMVAGKRREVVPHRSGQDPAELDEQLVAWLEHHVFAPVVRPPEPPAPARRRR